MDKPLLEWKHKQKDDTAKQTQIHRDDQIRFNDRYLMKDKQICNQLVAIKEKVVDAKVVSMKLNGFPASW